MLPGDLVTTNLSVPTFGSDMLGWDDRSFDGRTSRGHVVAEDMPVLVLATTSNAVLIIDGGNIGWLPRSWLRKA